MVYQAITVRIIVMSETQVLLLKKSSDSKNPDKLEFPGGKVDFNSNNQENDLILSAKRELLEETGIKTHLKDLVKLDIVRNYKFKLEQNKFERVVHYYCLKLKSKAEIIINSIPQEDKHISFEWVDLKDFQNYSSSLAENSKINIEDILD